MTLGLTPDSSECVSDTQPSRSGNNRLYYQNYRLDLPQGFHDPAAAFTKENFSALPESVRERLLTMLPGVNKEEKEEILEKLWNPDSTYFRAMHPANLFKFFLENQHFTETAIPA